MLDNGFSAPKLVKGQLDPNVQVVGHLFLSKTILVFVVYWEHLICELVTPALHVTYSEYLTGLILYVFLQVS